MPDRLPNGRDLGELRTAAGLPLRRGVVYRSAALMRPEHATAAAELGITQVYDLRTTGEREQRPDFLPDGATSIVVDLLADDPDAGPASLGALARASVSGDGVTLTADELDSTFVAGYRSFVTLDSARAALGTILRDLADPTAEPAVLHCTAGKDRTGWVAAVLLTTLGVPWDDVMDDYLRSGPAVRALLAPYREQFAAQGGDVAALDRAIAVYPHYLEAARAAVVDTFGGWDGYLREGLDIDVDTRSALVQRLVVG
ncbi:MAG: tyrosine-protein phosphatase [Candidatus Nanopelagicales bacterium]